MVAYLDSGSTANYISSTVAQQIGVPQGGNSVKLQMANKTTCVILGRVFGVKFHCGQFTSAFDAGVFPGLAHDILLGLPWLVKENPQIDFQSCKIQVLQGQDYVALPIVNCPKPQMRSENNPFMDHKDMLIVV